MTPRFLFAAVVYAAAALSSSFAQSVVTPGEAPAPAAPPEPTLTPEQFFEGYGWILGDQSQFELLGMSETEVEAMVRGFTSRARGEGAPPTINEVAKMARQFLNDRAQQTQEKAAVGNRAEEAEFLAKIDQNPAVKKTASGLRYEIVVPGSDPKPAATDTVVAHYVLTFADGKVVESSKDSGQPAEFALNAVVPAWTEGLQLIGTGGQIKLYVPSALGYGDRGSPGGIPPAKLLVFDVELVAVKATPVQLPSAGPAPAPAPAP